MADATRRTRRLAPADPGGEPICLLTADGARARRVPIDRLLGDGTLEVTANGYEIRLPPGEPSWRLANRFAEEEAECCPALALEVEDRTRAVIVRATFASATVPDGHASSPSRPAVARPDVAKESHDDQ